MIEQRNTRGQRMAKLWVAVAMVAVAGGADWLQFRGTSSNSVASDDNLPTQWSETENLAWKAELPGRGPSSPIVIGDRVVVTASSGVKQDRLHVLCFDVESGKRLWERQFWATGRTLTHPQSANAAPTPASDGKLIFAFFSSNDLVCLDLHGNVKWLRGLAYDYPYAGNDVGMSSSPAVSRDTVIVQVENQGDSFAAGIDAQTGETRWRLERERLAIWVSPVVIRGATPEDDVVVLQSATQVTAHDPLTGKQRWSFRANSPGIPSPVAGDGVVFLPADGITALRPGGDGAEPELLWKSSQIQPGAASPLLHDGRLYAVNRAGVMVCADAESGEVVWRTRLQGQFWGTPVLAGNRLYCINNEGVAQVIQLNSDGQGAEVIGNSEFGEVIQTSPAVANGALYVRSDRYLWKVGAK